MNVLHIVEPFASGVAVFVKSLTEAMPYDRHIIIHGERGAVMKAVDVKRQFPKSNVRFIRWKFAARKINPVKDFIALRELYLILSRLKKSGMVDVVHLHSSKSGLLGRAACRLANIENVFYTPNGAAFHSIDNKLLKYFYKQIEIFGNRLGGQIVCCSESELMEYQKIGIDATYINNGVSIERRTKKISKKVGNKLTVVTSGRIEAQKQPMLFNAIAGNFEGMDQIKFLWIGDGPDKESFTAKNIEVTGWLEPEKVKEALANADVYLSTSKYEGLSFAVLEALALKMPVLLSNCVGNSGIVKKGLNGDLFDNKEEATIKLLQYLNNREMLSIMGLYSQEICKEDFDMNKNFKKYHNIYKNSLPYAS